MQQKFAFSEIYILEQGIPNFFQIDPFKEN